MKNFAPTATEVKAMQAEKSVGMETAKSILTGRQIMTELNDISANLTNYGYHPDYTQQQLARLTDVIIFMVANGSIKF